MPLSTAIRVRLEHQHEAISGLLATVPENKLRLRVNPDKWSAFENLVHLISYQPAFIQRLESMLRDEQPLFQRYRAEDDPAFPVYLQKSFSELETELYRNRSTLIHMLEGLDAAALARYGIHIRFGKMDISEWVEFFLLHEAHHLFTVFSLIHSPELADRK